MAVRKLDHPTTCVLLEHGAIATQSQLLLHHCVEHRQLQILELLLQHGWVIDIRNLQGLTPLLLAIENHHPEAVQLLLKHGSYFRHKRYFCKYSDHALLFSNIYVYVCVCVYAHSWVFLCAYALRGHRLGNRLVSKFSI